ncbi:uncharacterized protein Z518_04350 [Rhinocladiella mackenziei CBS 650.93]|uniref:Rhinocladiella mackenziei CBS 650.93 unplaced genomic scaffold supercont1.3, whole genome shotgun sequence n=1 Tax=Rhinocladiella mackenziei CBS 650.93 TaxID=1442369 RepID=A0A0D2IKZ6_9EURO|nr:uncharacterized protein Z518_04350 [Rhinocladiella mackenziei CBS 650.93]KIX06374.1 hypothetical protein Z518_04350 [Rhinocladiella mackenziei CBS 650.93]
MSYADAAAKGPKQAAEEVGQVPNTSRSYFSANTSQARAAPVPSLSHSESESASLIDVDSPHVSSVKSDFQEQAVKTETQAERVEHELEEKAHAEAEKLSAAAESANKKAVTKGKEVRDALEKDRKKLSDNKDNPVIIGNAIIWGLATLAIGYGAYQKHVKGQLDWQLAGTVAGCVSAFAVADYFGSKWLFENKYPPK